MIHIVTSDRIGEGLSVQGGLLVPSLGDGLSMSADGKITSTVSRQHVQIALATAQNLPRVNHGYSDFPSPFRISFTSDREHSFRISYHAYGDVTGGTNRRLTTGTIIYVNGVAMPETEMLHESNPASNFAGNWNTSGETFLTLSAGEHTISLFHSANANNWGTFTGYTAQNLRLSADWLEAE